MAKKLTPEEIIGHIKKMDIDALVVVFQQVEEIMEEREKEALEDIEKAQQKLSLIQGK